MVPPLTLPEPCLLAIELVYTDLDRELAALGHSCRACGQCCDLVRNNYRLYLSTLELALIRQRLGVARLPPQRDGRCGFQLDAKCTIHQVRPLGCRTFFCQAKGMHLQELYDKYLKRLKALADRYAVEWNYSQKYPEA